MAAAEALAGFLRSLGVTGDDIPPDRAERAARYRTLLAERRMLVAAGQRARQRAGPAAAARRLRLHALVTSRDSLPGLVAAARRAPDRAGACCPMRGRRPARGAGRRPGARRPGAAAALADQCVRLPLALRLAAELAADPAAATLAELVAELADLRQRLRPVGRRW